MLNIIQVLLWAVTYLLIIIAGFQSRHARLVAIPHLAVLQNFAWEACAMLHSGIEWSFLLWLSLDLVILLLGLRSIRSGARRLLYLAGLAVWTAVFLLCSSLPNGMVISCFVIDLLMAVYFLLDRRRLSPHFKRSIAVTKLLGDTFAGLFYARFSDLVAILALFAFICNVSYLLLCVKDAMQESQPVRGSVS